MFADRLTAWYQANKRPLPWREDTDPYHIWVSEIILQQTRVQQGTDYYLRFVRRFPNVAALAEAEEEEVLKYWQGLGYYSRARNLHAGARYLQERYPDGFPTTYEEIRGIKGVGPYTAAAIASFAFQLPYPVVDGNVLRVLSRVFGVEEAVDASEGRKVVETLANSLIPKDDPATFNQAIMDFGALQCVPHQPFCTTCPFTADCYAFRHGLQDTLPFKRHKTAQRDRYFYYWVLPQREGLYMQRRGEKDIWQGLYEFPLTESGRALDEAALMQRQQVLDGPLPEALLPLRLSEPFRHVLSHQVIHAQFVELYLPEGVSVRTGAFFPFSEIRKLPVSRLIEKYLDAWWLRERHHKFFTD
ncbi:MAG: A/G-specific adenine glycosylase [Bacteroidales bacterium]|nr:A/G-specific adenine glycosylase [Bacteroidales bacterium]